MQLRYCRVGKKPFPRKNVYTRRWISRPLVYRSRDTRLKRYVAIKVLPSEWTRDPDRVHRFQREAQVNLTVVTSVLAF